VVRQKAIASAGAAPSAAVTMPGSLPMATRARIAAVETAAIPTTSPTTTAGRDIGAEDVSDDIDDLGTGRVGGGRGGERRERSGSGTPAPMDPLDLLRLLLEPARLAVVGDLVASPRTSAELAGRHDLPAEEVLRTLAPLVQDGLVAVDDGAYHLDVAAWRDVARTLPRSTPPVHGSPSG
jgi:hypothetical protein